MKKDLAYFEHLEDFVSFSYGNFGNSLQVYERPFSLDSPLGYCYKYSENGITIYKVVHSPIGKEHTDRRIVAHEYGHLVLGHLDGIHEHLDGRILWTIQNNRQDLIDGLNKEIKMLYPIVSSLSKVLFRFIQLYNERKREIHSFCTACG